MHAQPNTQKKGERKEKRKVLLYIYRLLTPLMPLGFCLFGCVCVFVVSSSGPLSNIPTTSGMHPSRTAVRFEVGRSVRVNQRRSTFDINFTVLFFFFISIIPWYLALFTHTATVKTGSKGATAHRNTPRQSKNKLKTQQGWWREKKKKKKKLIKTSTSEKQKYWTQTLDTHFCPPCTVLSSW